MRISRHAIVALAVLAAGAPGARGEGADPAEPAAPDPPATEAPAPPAAPPPPAAAPAPPAPANVRESVCLIIESAARANDLPLEFFARVIWQESRFRPDAVGPVTRSGQRAQGIAQFMPGTAAERGLLDPFDPVQALPKSAEFLRDLRRQFGNLGLAAAAYNAGPQRVRDWLAGARTLPAETRNYVLAITGLPAEDWARSGNREPEQPARPNCAQLMAMLTRAPNAFVEKLTERVNLVAVAPWGVQLSANFSRDKALASYAALARRYGEILAGRDPSLLTTTLRRPTAPTFYQVRVGADTRAAAEGLCGSIRRVGGACLVLRNTPG